MTADVLGFVLGALDDDELAEAGETLEGDSRWRSRLEAVRRAVKVLEFDRDSIEPPVGLAERTCREIFAANSKRWPWFAAAAGYN